MGKVVTDDRHYKAIMDAVRMGPTMSGESCQPKDMAGAVCSAMGNMYSVGHDDGYSRGVYEGEQRGLSEGKEIGKKEGIEQGKQSEYDRFWDALQWNGESNVDMRYMFYGWPNEAYNPKYPIKSSYSTVSALFRGAKIVSTLVDIDFSLTTNCSQVFYGATELETIPKLIVCQANTFTNSFDNCGALVSITVEGDFGQSINFQWSTKLSKASIISIVNALSASASGKAVTFSELAVENAFDAEEWGELAATKSNWTINLV